MRDGTTIYGRLSLLIGTLFTAADGETVLMAKTISSISDCGCIVWWHYIRCCCETLSIRRRHSIFKGTSNRNTYYYYCNLPNAAHSVAHE